METAAPGQETAAPGQETGWWGSPVDTALLALPSVSVLITREVSFRQNSSLVLDFLSGDGQAEAFLHPPLATPPPQLPCSG